jgi:hypothetical protein
LRYDALVTYTGWYSRLTIPGFSTRVRYEGELVNFTHYPSILYEVTFMAYGPGWYGAFQDEAYYEEGYAAADGQGFTVSFGLIAFVIVAIMAFILFMVARKRGWFGLSSLFKKDKDEQEEDFN